jgi:starch synthase
MAAALSGVPTVAIFPWGDVVEEFLDPIGLDISDFIDRMSGGWLFGYVAALQSAGWRAVVVCVSEHVSRACRARHAATGAAIWLLPGQRVTQSRRRSGRSLRQWLQTPLRGFAHVLRDEQCDIVLVQEYEYTRFDALALLCGRLGLPLFATFQGGDVTLSALEARVRRWSLSRARGLIIASARERARIAQRYPHLATPVASIANPLDAVEWQPAARTEARAKLGVRADEFLVVSHGRIDVQRKGLDVLLGAWRMFSARFPEARLQLIGAGQDQALLRQMLDEVRLSSVSWDGRYTVDRSLVRYWLSAADAYVTTSRTEGMPVAPLEAMACGLPVVASRAQGLPEIFAAGEASGGILVDCEDAASTAAALERLADSPSLRCSLGYAGRATIETHFSIATVGTQLVEFFGTALAVEQPPLGQP